MRSRTRRGVADHVDAVDLDRAGGRREQADQHADGGALARAVGAEEREDRARLDRRSTRSSTAVKSPKRLVRPRGADDRRGHGVRRRRARSASSVASMSSGTCSAKCDAAGSARERARAPRARPGVASRGTSTRAKRPLARASPTHGSARAARAMARGVVAPGAVELERRRRARSSAGVPLGDDAAVVEIDEAVAGRRLVEVARADRRRACRARRSVEDAPRSRRARRRRRRRSARRG